MRIAICDDLSEERDSLREHIHACALELGLEYTTREYDSAEALLAATKGGETQPDLLFLDIYMGGITGMEAAKQLIAEGFQGTVIFTTTSESHSVESYKIMADGYLLKPYSREEFRRNFRRAVQNHSESFKTVSFPCDRLEFRVFQKDLEFVEAAERGSLLHAKGENLRTTKPVSEFARELLGQEQFLQCHRSCLINLNFVSRVEEDYVLMKGGAKAPLAMQSRQAVKRAVSDYFFLKMRGD